MPLLSKFERLSTLHLLGGAFGIWVVGAFIVSPIFQNIGYLAFLQWEMYSPLLISVFLYARSIQRERTAAKRVWLHLAWIMTIAIVAFPGADTWGWYQSVHDAPRGVLWDLYQFSALICGGAGFWFCYALGAVCTRKWKRSQPPVAEH